MGLPHHLWNKGIFKAIGVLYEDLLSWEVPKGEEIEFLVARIRIRKCHLGKIPSTIDMFDRGQKFQVALLLEMSLKLMGCWPSMVDKGKHPMAMEGHGSEKVQYGKLKCSNPNVHNIVVGARVVGSGPWLSGKGVEPIRCEKGGEAMGNPQK